MARMTNIVCLGVAATTLALSTQAQAACNIRGEHCGRPAWAANAFSGPYGRAPESALAHPTHQAPGHYYQAPRHSRSERAERVIVKKAVREKIFKTPPPVIVVKKPVPEIIVKKAVQEKIVETIVPERVVKKTSAEKIVETVVPERAAPKVVPLVKFADGEGRQFDPASKVWFDGKSQCWSGAKQFTFKNSDWFYGKAEWTEANGTWSAVSGEAPELVSCESVPSFAAKANAVATKAAAQVGKSVTSQPAPVISSPAKIKTADGDASAPVQKPVTPAASPECKKYFPSVGQLVPVPCTE